MAILFVYLKRRRDQGVAGSVLPFTVIPLGAVAPSTCDRCGTNGIPTHHPVEDVIGSAERAVSEWQDPGAPNVELAGPEPFDHPALPGIVTACVRAGAARVRLLTDGAALGVGDNAAGCLAAGVRHVRVRLLGDGSAHDALVGRPGAFESARVGVRAYSQAAVAVSARVHVSALVEVCEHNVRGLPGTIAAAVSIGAGEVVVRLAPGLDMTAAVPWVEAACDTGTVNRLWVSVEGVDPAVLGSRALHAVSLAPAEADA